MRRRGALAAAALLASGCASPLRRADPDLVGRLAVQVAGAAGSSPRSFAADFDLRGDAQRGELQLSGPLGATLAQLRWQPGTATLADGQGERRYATLEALSQDLIGESLPLAALIDWLRGRPWPGAASRALADGFEQLGWRIGLAGFAEGLVLATRDSAPAVSVRARLDRPA